MPAYSFNAHPSASRRGWSKHRRCSIVFLDAILEEHGLEAEALALVRRTGGGLAF